MGWQDNQGVLRGRRSSRLASPFSGGEPSARTSFSWVARQFARAMSFIHPTWPSMSISLPGFHPWKHRIKSRRPQTVAADGSCRFVDPAILVGIAPPGDPTPRSVESRPREASPLAKFPPGNRWDHVPRPSHFGLTNGVVLAGVWLDAMHPVCLFQESPPYSPKSRRQYPPQRGIAFRIPQRFAGPVAENATLVAARTRPSLFRCADPQMVLVSAKLLSLCGNSPFVGSENLHPYATLCDLAAAIPV